MMYFMFTLPMKLSINSFCFFPPGPPQMHSPGMHSPTSSMGSPPSMCFSPTGGPSPSPGLPHSSLHTKHICAICGDRASGKHYGVYRWVNDMQFVIKWWQGEKYSMLIMQSLSHVRSPRLSVRPSVRQKNFLFFILVTGIFNKRDVKISPLKNIHFSKQIVQLGQGKWSS